MTPNQERPTIIYIEDENYITNIVKEDLSEDVNLLSLTEILPQDESDQLWNDYEDECMPTIRSLRDILTIIVTKKIDGVLIDINLQKLRILDYESQSEQEFDNGLQLAKALKKYNKYLPISILTTNPDNEEYMRDISQLDESIKIYKKGTFKNGEQASYDEILKAFVENVKSYFYELSYIKENYSFIERYELKIQSINTSVLFNLLSKSSWTFETYDIDFKIDHDINVFLDEINNIENIPVHSFIFWNYKKINNKIYDLFYENMIASNSREIRDMFNIYFANVLFKLYTEQEIQESNLNQMIFKLDRIGQFSFQKKMFLLKFLESKNRAADNVLGWFRENYNADIIAEIYTATIDKINREKSVVYVIIESVSNKSRKAVPFKLEFLESFAINLQSRAKFYYILYFNHNGKSSKCENIVKLNTLEDE